MDALFLDEGVSKLDQDEALPAVVDALINLQAGDRMIGVISHMENLAQRLPVRIEIVKNHGRSMLRTEGSANAPLNHFPPEALTLLPSIAETDTD